MGSRRARLFAATAVAMLLLAATVAFAASGGLGGSSSHTATAATSHKTAAPRALNYACARNLYNAKKVLRFIARPSQCKGSGKTLVKFSKDYPVYTCRKEHGGFAARQRRFEFPTGIRSHGPAGLMRLVDDPSKCAPGSQPNETPITLPRTSPRMFCAAKKTGELRWVNKASSCDGKEFPVLLAARVANVGSGGDPVANDDDATTDEDHATTINVLANDKNTASSNSNAGLQIDSINTTGTVGTVTVNPDGTISYDPAGKFESLKPGQTATDSFQYKAKKGSHKSDSAIVTVTITGVNDAPVAKDDTAATDSAHTKVIPVLSNDTDADGDSLTVASVDTAGTQGTVTINGDNTVTYNPGHAFDSLTTGATAHDTFKYKANDGHVDSNAATVDVTVTGAEDPPVVTTTSGSTAYAENAPATVIDGGVTVTDPDDTDIESAQVKVSVGMESGDTLVFSSQNGISGFYSAGTGVLTLSGTSSKANYQTALRSVQFQSTNDNPASTKTIEFKVNDGDLDSNLATKDISVTRVNDAPSVTTSGGNASFTEDSPATQVDAGITAADADSDQLQGAVVSITSNFSSADGDTLGFTAQNGITGSYNSGTGVLTLTGNAAKSDYQTALASITFSNTSDNPSTATRTVSFKVTDTSSADSNTATRDVDVVRHNDAPVVTTTAGNTAVAEGASATIDNGLTVGDVDDTNIESARVQVTSGLQSGDSLTLPAQPNITGSYNSGTGVLTLSGSDTVAAYQTALRAVQFQTTNDNPGASRTIEFKVNDGDVDSNLATKGMTVSNVNDAPSVTTSGGNASFTEDSAATQVDPGITVADPDDTSLESGVVSITSNFSSADGDTLGFTAQNGISGSYNSGTGVLTLSGTATKANYQAALASITFSNTSNTPSTATRTVSFKVNDGDADSNIATRNVGVTAHNDAPTATDQSGLTTNEDTALPITLAGTDPEGDSLTFTHDSTSAFGGTITGSGSSVTYTPAADYCGPDSFNFTVDDGNGGTDPGTVSLTVTCVNDAPVTDLNGTGSAGFDTTASFTEDSPAVSVAPNTDLSDVDDTNLESATITLTNHPDGASESLAVTTTGTSITPGSYNSGTGVLTLSGTDTKAHYQTVIRSLKYNNSSNTPDTTDRVVNVKVNDGDADSNEPHSTVSVAAHNDAPVATADTYSVNEDATLSVAAPGVLGNDTDSDSASITAVLVSAPTNAQSFLLNADGSFDYAPNPDFAGADSFTYKPNDGTVDGNTVTVDITVNAVNDAPVTDLNGTGTAGFDTTASFTEDSGAVNVAPNADITDVDNANLASATITLTTRPDTTAESLTVTIPGGNPITKSAYDNSTGTITLTGNGATVAQFQAVIRSLQYDNSSNTPTTTNRSVTVKVNDGSLDSNTATSTVSVTAHNDAPTANDQSGLTTNEDTALPITLTGSDPDGDPLTFSSDQPAHGTVTPTNSSSVSYTPDPDYCSTTPDTFGFSVDDGNGGVDSGTISITVTCVNDAPVVDLNGPAAGTGTNPSFAEQIGHTGGATTLAPNGTVSDVDDANLESLTVTLTNHPDNANEFLTADTTGTSITADAYNSTTGVLLLHGTDTKAHYQQVLRTVAYENDAAPPNPTDRTIDFVANDGDADSNTAVSTVSVVPLNAPPVLDLNSGTAGFDTTASFTEDSGPATLAPNATVLDADDPNLVSATVTLTNRPDGGAESLSANTAGTSITADAYVPATGVLFLHGSDTKANYQQVLRTVAYNNTSNTPTTTNRSITFKVNDGQDDSNVATADTSVTAHNDAPTATDQSLSTNEDTAKSVTLSGTDPENDSLTFTYDSTSAQGGTITGTAPNVTYTPALDYCNNATPDTFNFQADDGNGGTDSGTISITVTCVDDAPVVDLNGGSLLDGIDNNAAFTENQAAVTLATGATVSDVDNANISSATIVITNHPDGAAEGLTAVTTGTSITADAYNTGTGVLFLHGSDTKANYQQVIRSIAYNNTSDNPDTTNRDITWKVNDGSLDSAVAHTTLSVTAANDAPTLDLNGAGGGVNETASYTEDQPATTLAPNTLASDPDNANLQSATVTLTNHPDGALESLSVDTTGTTITPVAYNSGTGVLSLSGNDSVAHYQQVLRTIAYLNTSQNANTTSRVVNFVVNDGSSNSNSPTTTVTITVVNDPPVVDMNGGGGGIDSGPVAFTEDSSPNVVGSGPVNLGASATVSDVDNASLQSATLTVTNHPDGVNESLSVTIPGGNPITTGGYNASTGVLQLTGPATPAQFQTVIQSAKYNNVSNTPDPTTRDITAKVNDGAADSTVAHTQVTVTPTNDAPVAGDETFNATNSAVGNTTLNVNDTNNHGGTADGRPPTPDPTDTSPTTDRPHKEITGDIISNDTDPESSNSSLTVTQGTFATNDGGTVTIQADGDFNFEPAPSTSCTDTSDFFDYTVTDNEGTDTGTDTGRVTVAITGCVWYVNNNDAQGNSGTSEKPFDTTAQAQTASGNNQTTFVYDGDDTTTGYNTGYTMNTGESLISEGATLQIGSDVLHTADAANKASITNNNADVVTLAGGSTVKSFNLDPQGTGGGIFGTGLGATTVTLDDLNIADNGTKGTQPGLELDTNTGTTTNVSNLTVQNGDGSSATTGDEGVKLNNTGTVNFASSGIISLNTNGAKALDATAGAGTTNLGINSVFDDITTTNSGNGGVLLQGTTGSGTQLGDAVGTDLNLTTVSGAQPALSIQTSGTANVPSSGVSDIHATGGPAVDIVSPGTPGSTFALDDVDSTNSANDGINLDFGSPNTATFSATSGDIGGEAGIGFDLNGGSGAITYPGVFANGSGSLAAEVTGRTGGVVSLSGSMNDTSDAGGGVNIANNTGGSTVFSGATKQYNTGASDAVTFSNSDGHTFVLSGGGSDIDTTSGNGINATTSGTFQVSGSGNTIDSTALAASNRALNITDTDIAAADVTFDHINSSGGTNGIRVNNQSNTAGGLTVTGVGGTCDAGNQAGCSGGVIQSATDAGIDLASDTGQVDLTRMNVKNGGDDGIRATTVGSSAGNGIAVANSVIANNGNAVNENGFEYDNVLGISSINNTVSTGNADANARIDNDNGIGRFTVSSSTFSSNSTTVGSDGLLLYGDGTAQMRALVQNSNFTANRDDGFQLLANTDSSMDLQFNSNTVNTAGNAGAASAHAGLNFDSNSTSDVRMSMTGGTVTTQGDTQAGSAIIVNPIGNSSSNAAADSSSFGATFDNVTIGTAGVPGSGATTGQGFRVIPAENTDDQIVIKNSHINGTAQFGALLRHNDGAGHSDFTFTGNTIRNVNSGNEPIFVQSGSLNTDANDVCADIGGTGGDNTNPPGNDFAGQASGGVTDIAFRRPSAAASAHLRLPGFSPPASSNLQPYIQGRNVGSPTALNFSGELEAGPAACQQPTLPTAP